MRWFIGILQFLFIAAELTSVLAQTSSSACVSDAERTDCGYHGITEKECIQKDCCWTPSNKDNEPWCYNKTVFLPGSVCIKEAIRHDCGYYGINDTECVKDRGCCWDESKEHGVPWCFYKSKPLPAECKVDKPRTDCGYFGVKEEECTNLGCCWTPSPDKDVPWCYNKTEEEEDNDDDDDIITWSSELELTGITSACVKDAPRTDCGHYGIGEKECTEKDCCWTPTDKGPWCYNKTTFLPDSICIEEAIRYDCGYHGIDKAKCLDKGCCWAESDKHGVPWCFYKSKPLPAECKVDKPRTDCGYFGIKEEECTNLGCCWTPSPDKDVPWCYNKTEKEEDNDDDDDIITWSSELELTGITSACVKDAPRTDCGHYGIDEKECTEKDCCWTPTDKGPWCYNKTTFLPDSICVEEAIRYDCGYYGINKAKCLDKGCCWAESDKYGVPWCFYKSKPLPAECKVDKPRTDCGYFGIKEEECTDLGCCWTPSPDKDVPWCYNKTEGKEEEEEEEEEEDIMTLSNELELTGITSACVKDAPRTDCGHYGIDEKECTEKDCCWTPTDKGPWCYNKTTFLPDSICIEEAIRYDCGYYGIDKAKCLDKGCCWAESDKHGVPWCFYKSKPLPAECKVDKPRTDCGYFGIKEEECTNLGCCWTPSPDKDVPWCYNKTEEEEEEEEDDIMTWSSELESTSITSACVSDAPRTDCGHYGIDEKECAEKGCCWNPTDHDVPQCFYKTNTAPSASHEDEGSRYDSGRFE